MKKHQQANKNTPPQESLPTVLDQYANLIKASVETLASNNKEQLDQYYQLLLLCNNRISGS
jgi:hypothetical protein